MRANRRTDPRGAILRGWTDAGARNDSRPMPLKATWTPARRNPLPAITAALLLAVAAAFRAGAVTPDWSVEVTPEGELFPVLDLSQKAKPGSAPGGGNGLVIVRVAGDGEARHVRAVVETAGLREPAVVEATTERGEVELRPRLDWDTGYLRALDAPVRQPLRVTLERSGFGAEVRELAVRVHPLDDALYYVREGRDRVDLGWVFAAYVNPRDPVVEEVLALAREDDPDFDREGDDGHARLRKTRAIWGALARHGLRYAAGDPALSRGPTVYSQRVRLLADVWRERRANCLDGSVLIASVLERIGIPASVVLVPGHAFVGFHADADHVEFLETTLLGEQRRFRGGHAEAADAAAIDANFAAARKAGLARWQRSATRFDGRHGPDYAFIDIGTARSYGIIPLGAHGEDAGGRSGPRAAAGLSRKSGSQ